jgi:hypothetical protein
MVRYIYELCRSRRYRVISKTVPQPPNPKIASGQLAFPSSTAIVVPQMVPSLAMYSRSSAGMRTGGAARRFLHNRIVPTAVAGGRKLEHGSATEINLLVNALASPASR